MAIWYKVLNNNGSFLYAKGKLSDEYFPKMVNGEWQPGKWTPRRRINRGTTGWHLTQNPYIKIVAFSNAVWVAEGRGASEGPPEDTAFESMRLLRPYHHPEWWYQTIQRVNEMNAFEPPFNAPREPHAKWWHVSLAPTLHVAIEQATRAFRECACEPFERWAAHDISSHMAYEVWTHTTESGLWPVSVLVGYSIDVIPQKEDLKGYEIDAFHLATVAKRFWATIPVFRQSIPLATHPVDSEVDCLLVMDILEKGYLPVGRIANVWYVAGVGQ